MSLAKEWLIPVARTLVKHSATGPVYSLGDQITSLTPEYALRRLRHAGLLRNPNVPIIPSHENPRMVSFQTVLAMLGLQDYYDIDLNGKAAITCDFAQPISAQLRGQAGVVVDIGTSEHIFDLPQVFKNIVDLLQPGGVVLHLAPLSWYNHGFVNFNPVFFKEFYEHNQFSSLEHGLIVTPFEYALQSVLGRLGLEQRYHESGMTPLSFFWDDESKTIDRFANSVGVSARIIFLYAARKSRDITPVNVPCQGIYRRRSERST